MGRKNEIEGQLSFFDMLAAGREQSESEQEQSKLGQELSELVQEQSIPEQATKGKHEEKTQCLPGKFSECTFCWCATCEHSTVGGGVPRPFGESMRACPSCELCVREGKADVCVIGSAEEGCNYRARKEGLLEEI